MSRDRATDPLAMQLKLTAVTLAAELPKQTRRALDIREQESDRPDRQSGWPNPSNPLSPINAHVRCRRKLIKPNPPRPPTLTPGSRITYAITQRTSHSTTRRFRSGRDAKLSQSWSKSMDGLNGAGAASPLRAVRKAFGH